MKQAPQAHKDMHEEQAASKTAPVMDLPACLHSCLQGAAELGLAGVMIWAANYDSNDMRLLRTVVSRAAPVMRPCGGGFVGTWSCADSTLCCSQFGYCGTSSSQCGAGCR